MADCSNCKSVDISGTGDCMVCAIAHDAQGYDPDLVEIILPGTRYVILVDGCVERATTAGVKPSGSCAGVWNEYGDWMENGIILRYVTGRPIKPDFVALFGEELGSDLFADFLSDEKSKRKKQTALAVIEGGSEDKRKEFAVDENGDRGDA